MSREVERYGIYLADLDPTRGRQIAKTRPVVVISRDDMNRHLDTVVVCPLTTKLHPRWRSRFAALRGTRGGVLSDLLVGAHAAVLHIPILTRDVARFRTYFPTVRLMGPN